MADQTPREINPFLRQLLELGPPIAFFVIYLRLRDQVFTWGGVEYSGFIVATIIFVPIMLIAMGILWKLTGQLSRLQIFTAVIVVFFGALTWWFNDERFFKMKTTLVYGFFATLLGIGLVQGKSYLAYVLSDALPLKPEAWMTLTRRLMLAFIALAVANEIIWRTMSTDLWVKIETFGFPIALFAFLWFQFASLGAFEDEGGQGDKS
ncbi:inner membrane-spanning protein YciB [Pseudaestuariivita atlantica]|uniref:Inner membrane-spanning protein YciB n=1 Tax=Pseudaestuariivita atlantica TaxID=1317121 RepID=A0A0L1JUY1_9RHOB|nr:inner membrane-spanning protein YciB [Pseudaestuariivita atlantica]KNG95584.1 Intracellular septation protein A [Pseudaestuariivita atlantica]